MRKVCFVTGTRAEFGLMRTTLEAITANPNLQLQLVVTGMHVMPGFGETWRDIEAAGFAVDAKVPWLSGNRAIATGQATADLARTLQSLASDIVLVVGDRVEAFAAASAAHLSDLCLAQIHGGDRATGQADDSIRHAISKLAHVHLPATQESADRLRKMGEDDWRIHRVGAPGIDRIEELADADCGIDGPFALIALHPTRPDVDAEYATAQRLLTATLAAGIDRVVIIGSNNDPGHEGIDRCWDDWAKDGRVSYLPSVPRSRFLALLREAMFLAGNSSSGIIEAASLGCKVLDVGPRQFGRERSSNLVHIEDDADEMRAAFERMSFGYYEGENVYGSTGVGEKIAHVLARVQINEQLLRKTIAY